MELIKNIKNFIEKRKMESIVVMILTLPSIVITLYSYPCQGDFPMHFIAKSC